MNQHDDYFFSKRSSLRLLNPLCKSTTPNSKAHSSKTTRIFIVSLAKIPKYQVLSPISCSLESKPENIKSWILSKLCIVNHCDILKGRPRLETTRAALWLFYSIFTAFFLFFEVAATYGNLLTTTFHVNALQRDGGRFLMRDDDT